MTQKIAEILGKDGCYLFCILRKFGKDDEAIKYYPILVQKGLIKSDCFVLDPAKIAELVSGQKWTVRHERADYVCKEGEWEIQRWERKTTGVTYSHFTLPDWDPLGTSVTRNLGTLVSKRVFRRM